MIIKAQSKIRKKRIFKPDPELDMSFINGDLKDWGGLSWFWNTDQTIQSDWENRKPLINRSVQPTCQNWPDPTQPTQLGRFLGFGGLGWITNFFL